MARDTRTIPSTMRASVLHGAGRLSVDTVPVPVPEPDQVLIKVAAVGVCGSDVHYYQEGRLGPHVVESPLILGHEASGTIVAVGVQVDPGRVGQRVAIEPQRCCRICDYCRSGEYNLCREIEFYATPPVDGAFCEYVTIQDDFAFAIPDTMSDDAAALLEPLSVAIATMRKAEVGIGARVLIAGAGPIGIMMTQAAAAFGAGRIVVTDPVEGRRALAVRLGATQAYPPGAAPLDGELFDAFIDASGATAAVRDGIQRVRAGGRAILVGLGEDDMLLPVSYITSNEIVVTGVFRYHQTWPTAIELAAGGKVDLDALVTARYGLDAVAEALNVNVTPTSMKHIVRPGE